MRFSLFLIRLEKLAQVIRSPRLLRALASNRVLASAEHRRILTTDLETVVDIGANRGQFALAVRQWAPKARVIAFEPLPGPASRFRKLFQGDSRVTLHRTAIGAAAGTATMHVSAADDSSSLLPISEMQERLFPGTAEVRTEVVEVGQLCDFISCDEIMPPALLKIDVQGYELETLKGCTDLIHLFDLVMVECSFMELYQGQAIASEVIRFLDQHGFILCNIHNLEYNRQGEAIQGDFVFSKTGTRET
jgi:FkbM family methyltransferase